MSVDLISKIVPKNDGAFPMVEDIHIQGGYQTRADLADRDSIPVLNRKEGMHVFVLSNETTYRLDSGITNSDWVTTSAGGGGGGTLQESYELGNSIVTSFASGNFNISGTQSINLSSQSNSSFTADGADLELLATNSGSISIDSDADIEIRSAENIDINSRTGTISIGSNNDPQNVNIGGGLGAKSIVIGGASAGTEVLMSSGPGASIGISGTAGTSIDIGIATAQAISIGSVIGAASTTVSGGTGNLSLISSEDILIDSQGSSAFVFIDSGSDTSSSGLKFRNNSGSEIFTVLGSSQASFSGNVIASGGLNINADNQALEIGLSSDLSVLHDGINTLVTSSNGNLIFDNTDTASSIVNRLGTNSSTTSFSVRNNSGANLMEVFGSGDVRINEGVIMEEISTPVSAGSSRGRIYVKEDPSVSNFTELWFYSNLNGTDTDVQITRGGFINSPDIVNSDFVALAGGVSAGSILYLDSATEVGLSDSSTIASGFAIGIALDTASAGNTVRVQCLPGVVTDTLPIDSFSSAGDRVYLSSTPGELSVNPPSGSGSVIYQVGYAVTATKILFQPQLIAAIS